MILNPALFNNKYRIATARRPGWDYNAPGYYFITLCTQNMIPWFGVIKRDPTGMAGLFPSKAGELATFYLSQISSVAGNLFLDAAVVMPNHVHFIIAIAGTEIPDTEWKENQFDGRLSLIPHVIRQYKARVCRFARKHNASFSWQSRYYDRIIRTEEELETIRYYINQNPERWILERSPEIADFLLLDF